MKKLKRFAKDRYGGDQLSLVLLILSVLLTLVGHLTKLYLFIFISYIPLIISVYRMFSKNIHKRRMENYKFSIYISPIYSKYKNIQKRFGERKTHKFFKCPDCKSKLRLPKGKGRIIITCPKCNNKFEKRT